MTPGSGLESGHAAEQTVETWRKSGAACLSLRDAITLAFPTRMSELFLPRVAPPETLA